MTDATKFITEEQHQGLIQMNERWNTLSRLYGELHFRQNRVKRDLAEVEAAYEKLEHDRTVLVSQIQQEMGSVGEVDLKTREFRPIVAQ